MRLKSALLLTALTAVLSGASAADDPQPAQVESGLVPPSIIAGRKPEVWTIPARMAYYDVPGVSIAVIEGGTIAWARGYGVARSGTQEKVTPDTLFQAASLSKPLTAAAALSLVETGQLSLDADVNTQLKSWQLPGNPIAEGEVVTLRRLLSHTAGIDVHGFAGYAAGVPRPTLRQVLDGQPPANSAPVRIALKPGSMWRYSGGGYCIVQQLLLDRAGPDFAAVLHERVLQPAGMNASTFAQPLPGEWVARSAAGHDDQGQRIAGDAHIYPELAAAGLWTTPADLARFGLALAHSLTSDTATPRLFSRATAETMISVPLTGSDCGLGFGVKGSGENVLLSHSGANEGFRAMLVLYPRTGRGAVIMTNGENGAFLAQEIIRSIARAYQWPDYQPEEKTAVSLTPEAFDAFAGRYERDDTVLLFYRKDGHFYLRMTKQPRAEIFPQSDHEFFLLSRPDVFTFETDAAGLVTHVIRRANGSTQLYPRVTE